MRTIGVIETDNEITDFINNYISDDTYECKKHDLSDGDTKYDILIDNLGGYPKNSECFIYMLNSDEKPPSSLGGPSVVISYGLNSLATVTASSISDDSNGLHFQYCLQREMLSIKGNKIEPQEFPVHFGKGISIHSALACVTFALLCGKDL